ncbi:MAG: flavin reductase family protein [Alphaproteobacteria bacterium]|nr:flavin reductase family protein [Alphaproteobacteria bacterium]
MITTRCQEDKPIGITVNSFTSVSLDPPLVLFCLKKKGHRAPLFAQGQLFSISVLSQTQQTISHHFATHPDTNWDAYTYSPEPHHPPFIKDSLAQILGERAAIYEGGDHDLYLIKVLGMHFESEKKPLLFFQSHYAKIQQFDPQSIEFTKPL